MSMPAKPSVPAIVAAMLSLLASAAAWAVPTVTIRVESSRTELLLGAGELNRATIGVWALVEEAAGPQDGLFTFDLALIVGDPAVVRVVPASVERPGAEPLLGGGPGQLVPWGLDGVSGGYLRGDVGLGGPHLLFSVDLVGRAEGRTTVGVGPDTDVYGVDLLLYQSPAVRVVYDLVDPRDPGGAVLALNVRPTAAIPEPGAWLLAGVAVLAAPCAAWRRHTGAPRQP